MKWLLCFGAVEDDRKLSPPPGRASGKVDCQANLIGFYAKVAKKKAFG